VADFGDGAAVKNVAEQAMPRPTKAIKSHHSPLAVCAGRGVRGV
jgi:hypothetical protein